MKKLIIFLLSLICFAAHAQYNQGRTSSANSLSYHYGSKVDFGVSEKSDFRYPYFLYPSAITQAQESHTLYSSNPTYSSYSTYSSDRGYWAGPKVSTTMLNGRFQAVQSYDIQGNLRESKATFQFKPKKKR